ncbi:MAG: response regulator [Pirellulaceae bacterium]|nr:response regulator [Pirellulaceae bacterium]
MSLILRAGIIDPEIGGRELLRATLARLDAALVETECDDYASGPRFAKDQDLDVVFVGIDANPQQAIEAIRRLSAECERCPVIAFSRSNDGTLILRSIRAGAKEFLTIPINADDLATALQTVKDQVELSGSRRRRSTVIAVAGATGGAGSTSLAVNLATILAADPAKAVVLVDLDIPLGDADVLLDAVHEHTLMDVAENVARLDFDLLRRSLKRLDSGLYLLPRPAELQEASLIDETVLRRILSLLEAGFSHVIVDLSKGYTPLDLAALQQADITLMVAQLNLPSLRNCVRLLKAFRQMDDMDKKVRIVVNRFVADQGPIRLKKAQEILGREIFWQIPNDYRLMVDVCNNGVPLIQQAPKAAITQSIAAMAEALIGGSPTGSGSAAVAAPISPPSRWLNLWPSAVAR